MPEPKPIVIDKFDTGIAESPHVGFGDMVNVDTYSIPGTITQNFATVKKSSTTVTDLIRWFVTDPVTTNIYALGDAGKVYKSTDDGNAWTLITGNTTTAAAGNGLAVWKNYLFVARNTNLDVMKISDETWTNGWQTLTTSTYHPMIAGQDDILYIGNDRYVASVQEATGPFVPGTGSTYTWNSNALDLPQNYRIKCMAEMGNKLMIGTWQGLSIYDVRIADIFPWDRTSDSFDLPIKLSEFGINQMINVNNLIYIVAGLEGSIYVTNGSTTQFLRKLPRNKTGLTGGAYADFLPGAIMYHHNRIHLGMSTGTTTPTISGLGVWSLNVNNGLVFENDISTGVSIATNALRVGALYPGNTDTYLIGWQDNATYGIDQVNQSARISTYQAYFDTPLFRVGTHLQKKTASQIEVILDRQLASGQGVRIKYRKSLSDSYTTLDTFDFSTYGAILSFNSAAPITDAVNLQFRIEITGTTPCYVKEVRLI